MTITPAVPGTINVPSLTGDEVVRIDKGSGAGQTTTQAIANLGGGGGLTLISSGNITTPQTSIILNVDDAHCRYTFEFDNWVPNQDATLALQVSVDGTNFIGSNANSDEYAGTGVSRSVQSSTVTGFIFTDVGADIAGFNTALLTGKMKLAISGGFVLRPGDGTYPFSMEALSTQLDGWIETVASINQQATLFDPSWNGRIKKICVQFYQSVWGDSEITQGTWTWFGTPNPT